MPAGGDIPDRDENPKFGHKIDFVDELRDWFTANPPQSSMLVGDLNIAPLAADVWSTRQLRNVVSHTDIEREKLALAINEGGWVDVNAETLQHNKFSNIFSLGDVTSTSNAKTVAAARKQAPIVAQNIIAYFDKKELKPLYDGYGSCPLTVEKGKIILAEFGYGGNVMPSDLKISSERNTPTE